MTTNLMWPEWVLTPKRLTPYHVEPRNTSGGVSFSGSEQVIGNSPGRGRVVFGAVAINTAEKLRIWQTIAHNLGGRLGVIMVPALTRRVAPWPSLSGGPQLSPNIVPLTDAMLFSNGAGLYARTILAEAAGAVAAGAVSATVRLLQGTSLLTGHVFQAGEYAYPIKRITAVDDSGAHPVFTVTLAMPAREAIAEGDDLDFDNPRFRAKLEDETSMQIDMDMWKNGTQSVAFVEDV